MYQSTPRTSPIQSPKAMPEGPNMPILGVDALHEPQSGATPQMSPPNLGTPIAIPNLLWALPLLNLANFEQNIQTEKRTAERSELTRTCE